ncbi:hypothetical protein SUGI_0245810 [Cryptomeria japonica]|nr:hypothetical protein SUGI_0245810 [Cryptomeria japonica]
MELNLRKFIELSRLGSNSNSQWQHVNIAGDGIAEEKDIEEVRRASIVAMLCIEKEEEVRPSVGQVVLMLEGKIQLQIQHIQSFAHMDRQADRSDTNSDSDGEVIC